MKTVSQRVDDFHKSALELQSIANSPRERIPLAPYNVLDVVLFGILLAIISLFAIVSKRSREILYMVLDG